MWLAHKRSRSDTQSNEPRAAQALEQPPIPPTAVLPATGPQTRTNSAALVVLAIYLLGLAVQTTRLLIGIAWTLRLSHRAHPIDTPLAKTWLPHWATLAESPEVRVPITIGYRRPTIILPTDWTTWNEEFLSMVLAHEAEHVRRRDTWTALLATLNTAVFWFHPVAWFVRRRLTDLAEQICDDEVIRLTGCRADYAQNLLEMAGRLTSDPRRLAPVGVAMARKANVVKRIEAIIDRDRPLSRRIGTLTALLLLALVVPLVFLAAGLRATDSSEAAEAEPISEMKADPDDNSDAEPSATTAETEDNGQKFVYVLDRSLNMKGAEHSPLEAAKAEVIASLDTLEDTHQFQIVFHNETPKAFNPVAEQGELAFATEQNKQRASRFVKSIAPLGHAEHEAALKLAIRTQPDVIFFLTAANDSQLNERQLHEIQRQAAGIQVNTIEFGIGAKENGENFLSKLARQNGGQYTYRNITKPADDAAKPDPHPKGLKGRAVLASDESPVAGAEIRLLTKNQNRHATSTAMSNERGEFEFSGASEGSHTLAAFFQNLSSRSRNHEGYETKAGDDSVVLELREVPSLKVKVVTRAEGQPIEDATVRLQWTDTKRDHRTDAEGEVLIQGLTAETWTIQSRAKGFAVNVQRIQLSGTGTASVTAQLEPGAELYGVVQDEDGTPLPDVNIFPFLVEHHAAALDHSRTDSEGKYRLECLPIAGLRLSLLKEGYLDALRDVTITAPPGGEQELNLTLTRRPEGGSVRGVVVDAEGKPVEGASLTYLGPGFSLNARETTADALGHYRLDDVFEMSGSHSLLVRANGFAPQQLEFTPGTRQDPAELNVTLQAGHRVRGRVIDEQGQPLPGVQVVWEFRVDSYVNPWNDSATTGSDGRFQFDSLPAESPFRFSRKGYSDIERVRLPLDGEDEVQVTMQSEGVIRGRVVDDETGNPVSPFTIRVAGTRDHKPGDVSASNRSDRMAGIEMVPDEDGTFCMASFVRGSFWRLTVEAEGYDPLFVPRIGVTAEKDAETVEFRLTPFDESQLMTFAGRLEDEHGQPIANVDFRLIVATARPDPPPLRSAYPFDWMSIRQDGPRNGESVLQFLKATTDLEGRFTFERVRPADDLELMYWGKGASQDRIIFKRRATDADAKNFYERVSTDGREQRAPYSAETLQGLTITTETPGIIRGSIDRTALPDLTQISLLTADHDQQIATLSPNKDSYELQNVAPGKHTLYVDGPPRQIKHGGQRRNGLKQLEIELKPGETVTVNLDSESPDPPKSTVLPPAPAPVPPMLTPRKEVKTDKTAAPDILKRIPIEANSLPLPPHPLRQTTPPSSSPDKPPTQQTKASPIHDSGLP